MRLFSALAATLLISTAALAQPSPDTPSAAPDAAAAPAMPPPAAAAAPVAPHLNWRQRFEAANVTHDGKLTREQAENGGMQGIAHHFDLIDADKKGYITIQDVRAYAQARRAAHAAKAQGAQR